MNRTTTFLALAAALGLVALVVKLPGTVEQKPPAPTPAPIPVAAPTPALPTPPMSVPGALTLGGKLSHPYVTPGSSDVFLSVDVSAVDVPGAARAPVNLAMVIDRSGSMSGAKIAHARSAALALVDQLRETDRLAVIHYGNDVVVRSGLFMNSGNKEIMRRFIRNIVDEGGTNIGAGLSAGKAELDRARSDFKVSRLLLVSDGNPTVGITSPNPLAKVVQQIRNDGVSVTSLGVGSDFNEDLMQRLAEVGGGSYGFIRDSSAMAGLFQKDLNQAATLVAQRVFLSFELPADVSFGEVLGRNATVNGRTVTVPLPDFSARQVEKLVVRVTARATNEGQSLDIAKLKLEYRDLLTEKDASEKLALAAMVTGDSSLAQARRDKDALLTATRAKSAINYEKAARLLEHGDSRRAAAALQENEALFDDYSTVAGEEAMKEDRAQNKQFFGLTTSAPSMPVEQQRNEVKAMKVQGLRSSGRGASLY